MTIGAVGPLTVSTRVGLGLSHAVPITVGRHTGRVDDCGPSRCTTGRPRGASMGRDPASMLVWRFDRTVHRSRSDLRLSYRQRWSGFSRLFLIGLGRSSRDFGPLLFHDLCLEFGRDHLAGLGGVAQPSDH